MEKAVSRVPTTKVVKLSQMLEEVGYAGLLQSIVLALELHDYHYHGPYPDIALSKLRDTEEDAIAVVGLVRGEEQRTRSSDQLGHSGLASRRNQHAE